MVLLIYYYIPIIILSLLCLFPLGLIALFGDMGAAFHEGVRRFRVPGPGVRSGFPLGARGAGRRAGGGGHRRCAPRLSPPHPRRMAHPQGVDLTAGGLEDGAPGVPLVPRGASLYGALPARDRAYRILRHEWFPDHPEPLTSSSPA